MSESPAPAPAPAAPSAGAPPPDGASESWWDSPWLIRPRIGWYGFVGYEWSRNTSFEEEDTLQRGMTAMLGGRFATFIWQPWFGQFNTDLRLHVGRNTADETLQERTRTSNSKNLNMTGNGRLALFHKSRFPFEARFDRSYSRTDTGDQPLYGSYLTQRLGITQRYQREEGGDASLDWDHSTQSSGISGKTSQDTLQLNMSYKLNDEHRVGAMASRAATAQKSTGQGSVQHNVSVTHNYLPYDAITVDTTANVNTVNYDMNPGGSQNRLVQLNSVAFWRPEEEPLTVTGSVRMLGLAAENTAFDGPNADPVHAEARLRTMNMNLGMNYIISEATSATANTSATVMTVNGERQLVNSQSAGITHSPAEIELGGFQYRWTTGASVIRQDSGNSGGNSMQLALQLSHSLNRRYQLDNGASVTIGASQGVSNSLNSRRAPGMPSTNMQVTHSAFASWSKGGSSGNAMVLLSASDTRALEGDKQFFQMVNLQVSGDLPLSNTSALNGNLTTQAVRQSVSGFLPRSLTDKYSSGDFVVTSSGSLSYRNQRLFGVRRLMLTSDVRMNSQAFLPMFGGPLDQEMAAWDTRLDYLVGMTTLRVSTLIARMTVPVQKATLNGIEQVQSETKVNKSIMFSVTRAFGS